MDDVSDAMRRKGRIDVGDILLDSKLEIRRQFKCVLLMSLLGVNCAVKGYYLYSLTFSASSMSMACVAADRMIHQMLSHLVAATKALVRF